MALSRRYLPVAFHLVVAALCVAASLLLALKSPDVGKAPNPLITFAIYTLPVFACMLIANAVYTVFLYQRGLPTRNLADALVLKVLRHWQHQDAKRLVREASKPENDPEIEQRPDL